jgi:membrane-associated phospholipid phosphatase
MSPMHHFDTSLFIDINRFARHTPYLHGFFQAVANYEIVVFAGLLLLGYLIARSRSDLRLLDKAIWAGVGTIVAVGVNQPIVNFFHEHRPYQAMSNILVLAHRSTDFSFPSDHTVMAGAVTAGLFLISPILGTISLLCALLLAFSRVYIAAHYPQDVLAGLIVGAAVMLIGYVLLRKPLLAILRRLEHTPLRILLMSSAKETQPEA